MLACMGVSAAVHLIGGERLVVEPAFELQAAEIPLSAIESGQIIDSLMDVLFTGCGQRPFRVLDERRPHNSDWPFESRLPPLV